ncbi:NPCBM/NEW2 domain-containing protein [Paenibacillus sp. HWE-109]|uniref:NPCBM/NEW2 domain-containing protein n=1 Tax=Paenibacillus sp. HWE-109 TaxID=1306526 RepID=UPI001EDCFA60|nr:NPCBM/NEW2 domain-containing protein [Paenibacillus sp. HWE-109]UKS24105.1 NPCBM/NEW2 domain-containing protein [Paenibacillus sp. HWE-109]
MCKKISTCVGLIFMLLFVTVAPVFASTNIQSTASPVVNDSYTNQKNYVDLRFGMFIHYNMGTYHDQEWVTPGQDPLSFNPEHVNTDQWAQAAESAGIKYTVLTTKHHDGFALWPTKYGNYNVMNSSYKKDIVRQYVDSMRAKGILPGLYFSIWDRQQGIQKGSVSRADIEFIKGQLTELLTNYGEIPVLIIDGWAWEMGHNEVPYQEIRELIKRLQPNILIVDHNGQTQPWDEDIIYFEEPKGVWAPSNNAYAANQGMPLVSSQWFWHNWMTNTEPASVQNIVQDHLGFLEPRYTNFLLNVSPNPDGELDNNVVNRLGEIGQAWSPNASRPPLPGQPIVMEHPITANSATATSGNASNAIDGLMDYVNDTYSETVWQTNTSLPQSITFDLGYTYNNINMLNYLPSQNLSEGMITSYTLYVSEDGTNFTSVTSGTWDGDKTMKRVTFPSQTARYVKMEVNSAVGGFAAAGELAVGSYTNEVPTRTGIDSFDVNTLYRIVNKATGKVLGVGNSPANGAAVAERTQSGALDQQWVIDDVGLGKYKIANKQSGQVMDVPGASKTPEVPVIQWTDSETAADPTAINQQWTISNVGNGYFKITNVNSRLALEISNGSAADGNPVVQNTYTGSDSQLWKVEKLPSLIKNVKVNGVSVKGLNSENRTATLTVLREKNLEVPTVTADKASEDVQLVIHPADSLPGATTITATADGGATQEVYTLNFELVDRYASDLEWLSASSGWLTVKKDKSLDGNTIRLMGNSGAATYEKGFGVHAESRIIFDISDKNYESFTALAGVDQEMAKSPSYADVEFKVLVDGVEKFASGVMKVTDLAKAVDVNVVGASVVELVVTKSDNDNSEDHASWANATFRIAEGKSEQKEELPEVDYLSDLNWISASSGWLDVKKDKSIAGNAIVLKNGAEDLSFAKGLGTHANSTIKYDLTGANYETFSAFIGVDKEVNGGSYKGNGSIQFKVSGVKNDDTIESLYSGSLLRVSDDAKFVKVNVKGYKELILEVTDSGNGNSEDHGDWANAKLTKLNVEATPVISGVMPVNVVTATYVPPVLPASVTVVYNNATTADKSVQWDLVDSSKYKSAGSFIVNGAVDGTVIPAVANVTVTENTYRADLVALIANAQVQYDFAVVGTAVGNYPASSKSTLQAAIAHAQQLVDLNAATKQEFEAETAALNTALQTFVLTKIGQVNVQSITVTNSTTTISVKGGSLQLQAAVLPANAVNKSVTWAVYEADGRTPTDKAIIDVNGLLVAAKDGIVKVVATANDGSQIFGNKIITISGQNDNPGVNPGSGSSSGSGNPTTSPVKEDPTKYVPKDTELRVEPVQENQTGVTATIDRDRLVQKLADLKAASSSNLNFELPGVYERNAVQLPLDILYNSLKESKGTVLTLRNHLGSYNLPLSILNREDVASAVDTEGAVLIIRMDKAKSQHELQFDQSITENGMKRVSDMIDYKVILKSKDKEVEITNFGNSFITRMMNVDGVIQDSSIATAVVYDQATGEMKFVPSVFTVKDGKTEATITRNTNSLYAIVQHKKTFDDMNGHWAQKDVESLASKMVIDGTTDHTYTPEMQVTRTQFAALLVRGLGLRAETTPSVFTDVSDNQWYASEVGTAAKYGLVQGVGEGRFNPDQLITREQMVVMMMKAAHLVQGELKPEAGTNIQFSDQDQLSDYARSAVAEAASKGLVHGKTETTFAPQEAATRAEAAVLIKQAMQYLKLIN